MIDTPKELIEFIGNSLLPKSLEKENNGEVFTPMSVVNEMLDELDTNYKTIHEGKSIFTNPDLTWFDPSVGIGNFPIGVYHRLIDGLRDSIPDNIQRKKHILEKMLYMSELNQHNTTICAQIFNADETHKLNLFNGDTLTLNIDKLWPEIGENGFDVVLGNPPFNCGGIQRAIVGHKNSGTTTLWPNFVMKALFCWLKNGGHLLFITPLSWMRRSHSIHDMLLNRHITWMKLWDNNTSKQCIHASIPISIYVLHNNMNNSTLRLQTRVISVMDRGKTQSTSYSYLDPAYSIPLAHHGIFNKLTKFIHKNKLELKIHRKKVSAEGPQIPLPDTYCAKNLWVVDTYRIADGLIVRRGTTSHPDITKPKLILANKRSLCGSFIDDGRLGVTGHNKFYILGNHLEMIKEMMSYKISNILSQCTKYSQSFLNTESMAYFPDIRKMGITTTTEENFYKLIGLTQEEIKSIQ